MSYPKNITVSMFFALFAAGAVFVLGFIRAPIARAADCGITASDVDQIAAIENDPSLTASEELTQELAVRKQLVGVTIVCAQQEAQALQGTLQGVTVGSDAAPLQAQLLGDVDQAAGFYNLELAKLSQVGITGTKEVAQEVLAWHENSFVPLSENINNFILWEKNQNLFNTAQTRMSQTQSAVSFLEGQAPNPALQSAFDSAQTSFNDAQSENAGAKAALAQGLAPNQSLGFIKQSLDSLSSTYQGFFTVSTLIKNSLPQ